MHAKFYYPMVSFVLSFQLIKRRDLAQKVFLGRTDRGHLRDLRVFHNVGWQRVHEVDLRSVLATQTVDAGLIPTAGVPNTGRHESVVCGLLRLLESILLYLSFLYESRRHPENRRFLYESARPLPVVTPRIDVFCTSQHVRFPSSPRESTFSVRVSRPASRRHPENRRFLYESARPLPVVTPRIDVFCTSQQARVPSSPRESTFSVRVSTSAALLHQQLHTFLRCPTVCTYFENVHRDPTLSASARRIPQIRSANMAITDGGPCLHCGTVRSSEWRRMTRGSTRVVLCNCCGVELSRRRKRDGRDDLAGYMPSAHAHRARRRLDDGSQSSDGFVSDSSDSSEWQTPGSQMMEGDSGSSNNMPAEERDEVFATVDIVNDEEDVMLDDPECDLLRQQTSDEEVLRLEVGFLPSLV